MSIPLLTRLYALVLRLYPRRFRAEFGEEMRAVFEDSVAEAVERGGWALVAVCWRELRDWPMALSREHWADLKNKKNEADMSASTERFNTPEGHEARAGGARPEALMGALPFLAFGLASMVSKTRWWPFDMGGYFGGPFLTFYLFVVIGLGVGWLKGLPRWAYAYLGWALVFAWWWTDMHTYGLKLPGYTFGDEAWGWRIWMPLAIVVVVVVLWTRSLRPLKQLFLGLWNDWTLLSFGVYTLFAWIWLVADENHNPYLLAFMAASAIVVAGGAWAYMRGARAWHRALALAAGFGLVAVVGEISEATWDWRSYYGVPAPEGVSPYAEALRVVMALGFWAVLLLIPALLGLVRRAIDSRRAA